MALLTWTKEISWDHIPKELQVIKKFWEQEMQIVFPRDEPLIGYPVPRYQLWNYVHNSKWTK